MNLPDLAAKLAENYNLTHREALDAVKLVFNMFTDAMKTGDRIEISGFGNFVMRDYKTYKGKRGRRFK